MADIGALADLIQSIYKRIQKLYDKHNTYNGNKEDVGKLQEVLEEVKDITEELRGKVTYDHMYWAIW